MVETALTENFKPSSFSQGVAQGAAVSELPPTGETAKTHPANNRYYPALDGVRTLAFLMVFGHHYQLLPWGWTGVDLFFVLSGFLITGILYDTRNDQHRARNFYVRRTLRIFPLYYGLMLVLVLTYPLFHWNWGWSWLLWPAYLGNMAFVRNFADGSNFAAMATGQLRSLNHPHLLLYLGHLWSLCVEEQFYLIWPWVVFLIRDRRRLVNVCLAFVVACPLLRVLAMHTLPAYMLAHEALYRATPLRADSLLLGGLIALLLRGNYAKHLLFGARILFAGMCIVLLLWLVLNPAARHDEIGYVYPGWADTWGLLFVDLFSACLLVLAIEPGTLVFRLFSYTPMRWFGRLTYGAYVYHDILHDAIGGKLMGLFGTTRVPGALVLLGVTTILAWASFRWFEAPFIQMKGRWTRS